MTKNLCNMWFKICEICVLSFQPRTSTNSYVRKNKLFMQNKANFRKVKLNVNNVLTRDYDKMDTWSIGKTKPIKANSKPKQTQYKANQPQNTEYMRLRRFGISLRSRDIINSQAGRLHCPCW
jgi:hypothetical protein